MNLFRRARALIGQTRIFGREYLGYELAEWPLLRVLLFSPWFRLALLLSIVCFGAAVAALPAIWRTSPDGFQPIIKINALNWLRARRLAVAGENRYRSGDFVSADFIFRQSLEHNPGNIGTVRSILRNALAAQTDNGQIQVTKYIPWLLALGKTNAIDLDLASSLLESTEDWERILGTLEPIKTQLHGNAAAAYFKALFRLGFIKSADEQWKQLAKNVLPQDATLPLYHAALAAITSGQLAGWDAKFAEARNDPRFERTASQLDLVVSSNRGDVERYGKVLEHLQKAGPVKIGLCARYWEMLYRHGRQTEAREKALKFEAPDKDGASAFHLAEAYERLQLHDEALALLEGLMKTSYASASSFVLYTDILREKKDWEKLRTAARSMRDRVPDLGGYGYYLEGLAEVRDNRSEIGDAAFKRIPTARFESYGLALVVANSLADLDRSEIALQLLRNFADRAEKDPLYWQAMVTVATKQRDSALLYEAASSWHKLAPDDARSQRLYAAALLCHRVQPEEALKRADAEYQAAPKNAATRINKALALNLNGRFSESETLLSGMDPKPLPPAIKVYYLFAEFELKANQREGDESQALFAQIDQSLLFTAEREHLQQLNKK